ncbi:MAG: SDR family oxidoreductase, partial [Myxococcota bacterium]
MWTDPDAFDADQFAAWLAEVTEGLEALARDRDPLSAAPHALRARFLAAAGRVANPDAAERKRMTRDKRKAVHHERRDADRALLDKTRIRIERTRPIFETPRRKGQADGAVEPEAPPPPIGTLSEARVCYVCHQPYAAVHFFYDQLCPACGDLSFAKRSQTADLRGRVALVTGGRVKIGYHTVILLLRAGCRVIVTTRFPHDAARRYDAEPDADDWRDRLVIHGIDLRHTPSVEALCARLLSELDRLDVIINNACQTVRRPPGFYDHLIAGEHGDRPALVALGIGPAAAWTQLPLLPTDHQRGDHLFPAGQLDADLQQVDLRTVNSWRLKLAEVPTIELLEVHLVNAVAPFV